MIITRSPLRISLGGGGTDLPSYYQEYGGSWIAAAIDKYVYINLQRRFVENFLLKYSHLEEVATLNEIKHPIIREAIRFLEIQECNLEISSMADIPAGTGLGSSSSFTAALLKALHAYKKDLIHPKELAEEACHIELDILQSPIGKQDQYITAYGGITCFEVSRGSGGKVKSRPLNISDDTISDLEDNLLLFFTGYSRSASDILREQDNKSRERDEWMTNHLHLMKDIGHQSKDALQKGNTHEFGQLMDIHWQHKKDRSQGISNDQINSWYEYAVLNGAVGGKLIGAGGGGFLMFYAHNKKQLRNAMRDKRLQEVRFRFDFEGTKILTSE